MTVKELLDEYELEIDDVRWYLATYMSRRLLSYQQEPDLLARYIWSGELEGDFYDMEEKLISDLQDQLERDVIDETRLRDLMGEMDFLRKKRQMKGL
ncbi:MAG: hypothetical protein PQJ60_01570 [Spirochaetales bacterium]|nr:hypothetical protein [Spirochaetales bacterium]